MTSTLSRPLRPRQAKKPATEEQGERCGQAASATASRALRRSFGSFPIAADHQRSAKAIDGGDRRCQARTASRPSTAARRSLAPVPSTAPNRRERGVRTHDDLEASAVPRLLRALDPRREGEQEHPPPLIFVAESNLRLARWRRL